MLGGFLDRWLTGWRAKALVGIGLVVLILLPPVLGANSYVTSSCDPVRLRRVGHA